MSSEKQQRLGINFQYNDLDVGINIRKAQEQGRGENSTKRLLYCGNMVEKKDKKTTLQLLHIQPGIIIFCNKHLDVGMDL